MAQTIDQLYQSVLGRAPDAPGQQYWQQQFGETIDPQEQEAFITAAQPEMQQRGITYSPTQPLANPEDVAKLYQDVLGRAPDEAGQLFWQQKFGEAIDPEELNAFKAAALPEQNVNKLYQDVLGRAPEQAGMDYWRTQIGQTLDPNEIDSFILSAYPEAGVAGLYKSILGREADEGGLKHWQEQFGDTLDQKELLSFKKNALFQELLPQNFNKENVNTFFALPGITMGDVNQFIASAKTNQNLNDNQKKFVADLESKIGGLSESWGRYNVDPYQAETVYNQIKSITEAAEGKNWQGSWMSGGDNAMREAAAKMVGMGFDNLAYLKTGTTYTPLPAAERYPDQNGNLQLVQTDEQGKKYIETPTGEYRGFEGYGTESAPVKTYLPEGAKTQIYAVSAEPYVDAEGGIGSSIEYHPLDSESAKTYDPTTGTFQAPARAVIDTRTGEVVGRSSNRRPFGVGQTQTGGDIELILDSYDTGNFIKGKDKSLRLLVREDGPPIPYITTEKTGLVYTPILPLALGFLLPGIGNAIAGGISSALPGSAISGGLAGTAAIEAGLGFIPATATNSLISGALGSGIMSGVTSELTGGDFGKGFLGGAFGSGVGSLVGGALPTDWNPAITSGIANTAGGVARTAVMGGDIGNALLSGVVGTGLNATLGSVAQQVGLTPQEMNVFSGIVAPLITKGSIGPSDILRLATQFKQGSSPYSQSQGATPYSQ